MRNVACFSTLAGVVVLIGCAAKHPMVQTEPHDPRLDMISTLWTAFEHDYVYFEVRQNLSEYRGYLTQLVVSAKTPREMVTHLAVALSRLNDPHVEFTNLNQYWLDRYGVVLCPAHVEQISAAGRYFVRFRPEDIEAEPNQPAPPTQWMYELHSVEGVKASMLALQLLWGEPNQRIPVRVIATDGNVYSILGKVHPSDTPTVVQNWTLPGTLQATSQPTTASVRPVIWGDFGYIVLLDLETPTVVEAFDDALNHMMDSRALILDLRANRGGNVEIASRIMGRFVDSPAAYAYMQIRGRVMGTAGDFPVWYSQPIEAIPRYPTYYKPVVVLVDMGTASAAELLALGLRDVCNCALVGHRTEGAGAALGFVRLPDGLEVQYSAKPFRRLDQRAYQFVGLEPDYQVELNRGAMCLGGAQELARHQMEIAELARQIAEKKASAYQGNATQPSATQSRPSP